ncbi:hypothetical protein Forpe1208_v013895 [Fusarium oxysporum f. sp. rapae]|uniref:Uncharacterized protein n=1 Tax=Fusarium oxysporum f. sp. rapae TaxID=485398 RepID=A0A8J5NT65_FUSOX|nr:hypothetical protein Forpe1208_v013895 [Fusarium oxysporum f. sp. rapae]
MAFASPWESMLAQAGPFTAGGPFQDLIRRLEVFKQKVTAQDAFLRSSVKENLPMAINRLEVALLQLYKFAVFIRGDSGDDDAASQTGFDQVKSIYTQAASLHADEFQQLQREIERALEQTKMDWENGRRQTEQYQQDVERCSRQMDDASNALRQAHDDVPDIGNQIGGMFSVVNQQNELNTRRAAIEQVSQQLPVLQATTDALNKQSAALLAGFTELREKATQLTLLMNDMKNGARDTGAQSWDKDRFAEGTLRLCQVALIDGRVCDEVETITNEISSGYSGQTVPGSVADLLAKVGQLTRDVAQKSITG